MIFIRGSLSSISVRHSLDGGQSQSNKSLELHDDNEKIDQEQEQAPLLIRGESTPIPTNIPLSQQNTPIAKNGLLYDDDDDEENDTRIRHQSVGSALRALPPPKRTPTTESQKQRFLAYSKQIKELAKVSQD
tara:strand:- start:15 stop:410 length:396 start_codon:yes stop_codon:yes gene_type:complete